VLGNVGIGTSSPAFKLDVASTQGVFRLQSTTGTNAVYLLTTNTGGDFYFGRENSTGSTFGSNTGYASVLYSAGAYPIVFLPNGTEKMRLDSSGNLGLGIAPDASDWNASMRVFHAYQNTTNGAGVKLESSNSKMIMSAGNALNYIGSIGSTPLLFVTNNTERARFNTTGAFVLAGGTTTANGIGITFPATQSASTDANTLDDYEEGTWTPTDGSGAGRAFSNIGCSYVKIGRQVTVNAFFTVDISASAAAFAVNGLPFSSTASTQTIGTFNSSSGNAGTSYISASSSSVQVATPSTYNTSLLNSQISACGVAFTLTYFV
jgi:hypothetical protein